MTILGDVLTASTNRRAIRAAPNTPMRKGLAGGDVIVRPLDAGTIQFAAVPASIVAAIWLTHS